MVVATLRSDGESDRAHAVYSEAYGIEMQFDDDWPVNLVTLVEPDMLPKVLDDTDLAAVENVSVGVTDVVLGDASLADRDQDSNVVLVGHRTRRAAGDDDETVNMKLRAALDSGCRVILCVSTTATQRSGGAKAMLNSVLTAALAGVTSTEAARLGVVHEPLGTDGQPEAIKPETAQTIHAAIRDILATRLRFGAVMSAGVRLLHACTVDATNVRDFVAMNDIDGVYIHDDQHEHFGDLLAILEALAEC